MYRRGYGPLFQPLILGIILSAYLEIASPTDEEHREGIAYKEYFPRRLDEEKTDEGDSHKEEQTHKQGQWIGQAFCAILPAVVES